MKTTNVNMDELRQRLAAAGFKGAKRLGMNVLKQNDGETVLIKVTGPISLFESNKIDPKTKQPATYDYVTVTNLETGETDLTYWLSGQIKYQFNEMENYIGQAFAITALGQSEVDGTKINQFDIQHLQN